MALVIALSKKIGVLLAAIWFILMGLASLTSFVVSPILTGLLALFAGIFLILDM